MMIDDWERLRLAWETAVNGKTVQCLFIYRPVLGYNGSQRLTG